jgi:hypothetical protein
VKIKTLKINNKELKQLILSIEKGEALALLQIMNEAKHRDFKRVQFESNS